MTLIAVTLFAGCAPTPSSPQTAAPSSITAPTTSPLPAPAPVPTPPTTPTDDLVTDFTTFSADIPAEVGVSVVSGPTERSFGEWKAGTAWSTIKVPLAIAALRTAPEQASGYLAPAIRQSDNVAAEYLWTLLGSPMEAAAAVQEILRDVDDTSTTVESERVRPGFTAFGQTNWPLSAAATFAWHLPCVEGGQTVIADMRQVAKNQLWGLAISADAATKGGWGPGENGGYLVRQLATISTPSGTLGVALAAEPSDGTFASGVDAINRLAEWVLSHHESFPATAC